MKKTSSLGGEWALSGGTIPSSIPARVPGSVYSALLDAGLMEDPYWRDNEEAALKLIGYDYTYSREIEIPEDGARLVCEGLDTVAELALDGRLIGTADNMHLRYSYELGLPKGTKALLSVRLKSPTKRIKELNEISFADGSSDAMKGFAHLRKAHCMFGWDWGARLPDAGIWKDMYFEVDEGATLPDVLVSQSHTDLLAVLLLVPEPSIKRSGNYTYEARAISPSGEIFEADGLRIEIPYPQLWHPNGYGDHPLYSVEVDLLKDGEKIDSWKRRIGIRDVTVRKEKDEWGESFEINVNGYSVFAMGADYIPEDHLLPRMTAERTRELLESAALANMNCIRIWGGGFYPFDWFYDACDELGLLVWQDFMVACAVIDLTPEFEASFRSEIEQNIKRLRHHPSLGLFCGNNEMEWQMLDNQEISLRGRKAQLGFRSWNYTPKQLGDYFRLYQSIMPDLVKLHAPQTFYWPASPSSGGSFDAPNDENRGDAHYWEVWHGGLPFTAYRKHFFRFASEFGFQSLPSVKTIETFTLPEDRNMFSYVMEKHQRNKSANGTILRYMGLTYRYPKGFEELVYATQLLQADAVRYGVEHFRRNRGRCMGAVYWQLNDCWPVASWASIDYFGRWKALQYSAKRFFAPVLVSAQEESFDTQGANVNTEPFVYEKSFKACVSNETLKEVQGVVSWQLRNPDSSIIEESSSPVIVAPLSSLWLDKVDLPTADMKSNYVHVSFESDGELVSSNVVLFSPPKHFEFIDPKLSVSLSECGKEVTVTAQALAMSVEIYSDDPDLLLDDNFFSINAGVKTVKILKGDPSGLKVRSVFDIS
ncbi:MAG: glycoside hydrolase family 2 protein [Clostridiales bacterium]|nr:glycoside hydrolase family 2 protein [Clostridiales bacterium]